MSVAMLCSGVRQTKKGTHVCRKYANLEYDGFCGNEHMIQGRKYATDAYDRHVDCVKAVIMLSVLQSMFKLR